VFLVLLSGMVADLLGTERLPVSTSPEFHSHTVTSRRSSAFVAPHLCWRNGVRSVILDKAKKEESSYEEKSDHRRCFCRLHGCAQDWACTGTESFFLHSMS
jgi:hypothetical protein